MLRIQPLQSAQSSSFEFTKRCDQLRQMKDRMFFDFKRSTRSLHNPFNPCHVRWVMRLLCKIGGSDLTTRPDYILPSSIDPQIPASHDICSLGLRMEATVAVTLTEALLTLPDSALWANFGDQADVHFRIQNKQFCGEFGPSYLDLGP